MSNQLDKKKMLHIGCGENIIPSTNEWEVENLDIRALPGVTVIAPAYPLKIEDNTYDLLYACHILEHYSKYLVMEVLREWVRITKTDGLLRISVPDFSVLAALYLQYERLDLMGPILGAQRYPYEYHYSIFDRRTLETLMQESGLVAIHTWLPERVFHGNYWDYAQAETMGVRISLNLEGRKIK